jgi:hypothetical protein
MDDWTQEKLANIASTSNNTSRSPLFGLDSTGVNHFLPQVVLVLGYRAVPGLDRLVLAHENLLGDSVE